MSDINENRYGYDLKERIATEISREVSSILLTEKSGEIIANIDLEEIIKRIQLNVVDNIVNGRNNYR